MAATAKKSFQPCPAIPFFDTSTCPEERRCKRPEVPRGPISNEDHAKQLEEIEHQLWVLCHYFKVFPEEGKEGEEEEEAEKRKQNQAQPEEKPPEIKLAMPEVVFSKEQQEELASIVNAPDPVKEMEKVVQEALRKDTEKLMTYLKARQPEDFLRNMFDMDHLKKITQDAEQAQTMVPGSQFDHSHSSLTEITTSVITVSLADEVSSTTTIRDQYGIPWQLRFRTDMDWLILDIDTSGCRHVMGQFKVLVRFIHDTPVKNFPRTVPIEVSRIRTVYCGTIGSVSQLREDGYFGDDGMLILRVAVIPMDPDAEQSTLTMGKRLKQIPADHNAHKKPKFAEGQLTIANFLTSHTTVSPPLVDANGVSWQLEIKLNQGEDEYQRKHMAIFINQCEPAAKKQPSAPDTCHEYFVELLAVDAKGWPLRRSGRMLNGGICLPDFLLKSRAEIYLKDGKLRLRWGVRRIPVR